MDAKKREIQRRYELKRRKAVARLRIALRVIDEYGLTWEYERACADEGLEEPTLVSVPQKKVS